MSEKLTEVEARIIGSLVEKQLTTPEYYPLTLNALVAACNQKSNRDPVTNYDQATIEKALEDLAWRKNERATGEQVNVQVKNGLSAVRVGVDDRAITVFGKVFLTGDFRTSQQKMTERFLMPTFRRIKRRKMLARNNQKMCRRLRADVANGDANIVLINLFRRNFARDNFAE